MARSTGLEAVDYEAEEVTITGTVVAIDNLYEEKGIGKYLVRLGGDSTQAHFNITFVLDPDTGAWPAYAADYESMVSDLVGKTVEVTGYGLAQPVRGLLTRSS